MQAIGRVAISNNWLTIIFIIALVLLVGLKLLNQQKLFGYVRAFFQKGFIEKKAEERVSFFNNFNIILYLFSILMHAAFFALTAQELLGIEIDFYVYLKVLSFIAAYTILFMVLDGIFGSLFEIQNELVYFTAAKSGYFYNTALMLFPFLIITVYSFLSIHLLLVVFIVLFTLSIVLTVINNKKLIINKLFYFILYLCALEIAPLLIIYKITV